MRGVPKVAWLILLLALLIRVAVAAEMPLRALSPGQDSVDYDRHGQSIARGNGYPSSILLPGHRPSAFRAPLYPYFLAAVYKVTGGRVRAARYAQALVGTLTVALIGLLAFQLAGPRVGLASLGLAAVFPPLIAIDTAILTEEVLVPLELGALAAALQHRRSTSRWRWVVTAGILGGLATLARPNGFLVLVPIAIALWPARPELALKPGWATLLMLAIAAVIVLPWTIRNAVEMHAFVPVSTEAGYALAAIYNDTSRTNEGAKGYNVPPQLVPAYRRLFRRRDISEAELDSELRSRAIRNIGDHPGYALEAVALNTLRLFHLTGWQRARGEAKFAVGLQPGLANAGIYGFLVLLVLAVLGCATRAMRRVPWFVWLMPLLFATTIVAGALTRYRAPIDPFLVILAGSALASAWSRLQRARATGAAVGAPQAEG